MMVEKGFRRDYRESTMFEYCGSFGWVEISGDGKSVLLSIDQLRHLRDKLGLKDFEVERQSATGKYNVFVKQVIKKLDHP